MGDTLTIQLFFFASGLTVALEAYKARGIARVVLWGLVGVFGIAGFVWPLLSPSLPRVGANLIGLATSPVPWFVLSVAVFFIIRPYWQSLPSSAPKLTTPHPQIAPAPATAGVSKAEVEQWLQGERKMIGQTRTDLEREIAKNHSFASIRLEKHREAIQALLKASQYFYRAPLYEYVKPHYEALEREFETRGKPENAKQFPLNDPDFQNSVVQRAREVLASITPGYSPITVANANAENAIREMAKDARFITILQGEEEYWPGWADKQLWYREKAKVEALVEVMRKEMQKLQPGRPNEAIGDLQLAIGRFKDG